MHSTLDESSAVPFRPLKHFTHVVKRHPEPLRPSEPTEVQSVEHKLYSYSFLQERRPDWDISIRAINTNEEFELNHFLRGYELVNLEFALEKKKKNKRFVSEVRLGWNCREQWRCSDRAQTVWTQSLCFPFFINDITKTGRLRLFHPLNLH